MKYEITRLIALIRMYGTQQVSLAAQGLLTQGVYGVNSLDRLSDELETQKPMSKTEIRPQASEPDSAI